MVKRIILQYRFALRRCDKQPTQAYAYTNDRVAPAQPLQMVLAAITTIMPALPCALIHAQSQAAHTCGDSGSGGRATLSDDCSAKAAYSDSNKVAWRWV